MEIVFGLNLPVWVLALIVQPITLAYYILNNKARRPLEFLARIEGRPVKQPTRFVRSIPRIFTVSWSTFSLAIVGKVVFGGALGAAGIRYMLAPAILLVAIAVAYLALVLASPDLKELLALVAGVVVAIVADGFIITGAIPGVDFLGISNHELVIPLSFPGLAYFIVHAALHLVSLVSGRFDAGKKVKTGLEKQLWDARRQVKRTFGFTFFLVMWMAITAEIILNQAGYSLLSW